MQSVPGDGFGGYQALMRHRVRDILLVASPYDSFILEEDGQFSERIYSQYVEMNLSNAPRFHHVTTGGQAIAALERHNYDLVLATPHVAGISPTALAQSVKERHPDLPIVMLTYDRVSAQSYADLGRSSGFDEVFLWTGDPRLLIAIVKLVEDRLNVAPDTESGGVRVIVVVEDSPTFYSAYLPLIYHEIYRQIRSLMSDSLNEADRVYRLRARPRILMARTYEGGQRLLSRFGTYLLGAVIDLRFPRDGTLDPHAGESLIRELRGAIPDIPVLLQSAEPDHEPVAQALGVAFADKTSPDLLGRLRAYMRDYLGFGPFVFRLPDGREVGRANDLAQLAEVLRQVPAGAVAHHAARNHFSNWLMARCEFHLAAELHPWRLEDFESVEAARTAVIEAIAGFLTQRQRGRVTDYTRGTEVIRREFMRLGGGSLGGKARGIAFLSHQLATHPIHAAFPGIRIFVPRTTVIGTAVFDRFVEKHRLYERAMECATDAEIAALFLSKPLPAELMDDLRAYLRRAKHPLAVRSSSLFEDSSFEPLAGMYKTLLLPNHAQRADTRLRQLARAIKLIYASTFFHGPRAFMEAAGLRHEEEKMAVAIQRLVGSRHADRFYPDFAGVALSRNHYPIRYLTTEEGIATVALGLGQQVVDGGKALRFSPGHPQVQPDFSTPGQALRFSQTQFFALDMSEPDHHIDFDTGNPVESYDLSEAEADGTLDPVGATYVAADDRIVDSLSAPGPRIVNFAGVLKYDRFPLAPLLEELLQIGAQGLGVAAELEFAVALEGRKGPPEIALLQLRPLVALPEAEAVSLDASSDRQAVVLAGDALGSGVSREIRDVVYVAPDRFEHRRAAAAAAVIGRINDNLRAEHRAWACLAPGRLGTADPTLGIPVSWAQVSGARLVAEVTTREFRVEASQGTHFFHNLTSLRVGYLSIDLTQDTDRCDLEWLESLPAETEEAGVRHVRLPSALEVRIDAKSRRGIALRER
ncbi:MAG: PEP/pyruvate-binding domain-containing protein [Planctomycetota bacterium]